MTPNTGTILVGKYLASVMIGLCGFSAVAYGMGRDWGRMIYWIAAAVLTAATTYWIK